MPDMEFVNVKMEIDTEEAVENSEIKKEDMATDDGKAQLEPDLFCLESVYPKASIKVEIKENETIYEDHPQNSPFENITIKQEPNDAEDTENDPQCNQESVVFNLQQDIEFTAEDIKPEVEGWEERPKNDDAPDEDNTPLDNTVNAVAGSSIGRNGSNDNDREVTEHVMDHKGGPPVGKRRKSEKMVHFVPRKDEANDFLKHFDKKQKNKKREIQLFCDLLCIRLEALDERKRGFVMHQINKLMINAKKPSYLRNVTPNQHLYQQPQQFTNFPQVAITPNQYQPSVVGSTDNSQSFPSPAPSSTSFQQESIAELFSKFNSNQQ